MLPDSVTMGGLQLLKTFENRTIQTTAAQKKNKDGRKKILQRSKEKVERGVPHPKPGQRAMFQIAPTIDVDVKCTYIVKGSISSLLILHLIVYKQERKMNILMISTGKRKNIKIPRLLIFRKMAINA